MYFPPEYRFLTIYNKDYYEKNYSKRGKIATKQAFKDPIGEGFKFYLTLDEEVVPPNEDGEEYYDKKFKETYKKLSERYFQDPLDKDTILTRNILTGLVTEYQLKYCDIMQDIEFAKNRKTQKVKLSENIDVPYTTYLSMYRNPRIVCPTASVKTEPIHPPTSLGPNEKINEILNIQTGTTQYQSDIGRLGNFIVTRQMHGPISKDCSHLISPNNAKK